MEQFKVVNGTYYDSRTPDRIIELLESARKNHERIRVFYGDVLIGLSWLDEYDTIGTISRSMGPQKIPILIKSSRSSGGGGILDHCIIRIDVKANNYSGHQCVYSNNFHTGLHTITRIDAPLIANGKEYKYAAMQRKDDGTDTVIANFETFEKMQRYDDFINGKSWKH
jgi:hypothetical protein